MCGLVWQTQIEVSHHEEMYTRLKGRPSLSASSSCSRFTSNLLLLFWQLFLDLSCILCFTAILLTGLTLCEPQAIFATPTSKSHFLSSLPAFRVCCLDFLLDGAIGSFALAQDFIWHLLLTWNLFCHLTDFRHHRQEGCHTTAYFSILK